MKALASIHVLSNIDGVNDTQAIQEAAEKTLMSATQELAV